MNVSRELIKQETLDSEAFRKLIGLSKPPEVQRPVPARA